jgi:hypothetical protein
MNANMLNALEASVKVFKPTMCFFLMLCSVVLSRGQECASVLSEERALWHACLDEACMRA